MLRTRG
jgi:hypothetical protein